MATITLHEDDSSDYVLRHGHRRISLVMVEDEVRDFAEPAMTAYNALDEHVTSRRQLRRRIDFAESRYLLARKNVLLELQLFATRLAGLCGSRKIKGERSPAYQFILDNRTPSTLLSTDPLYRERECDELLQRAGRAEVVGSRVPELLGELPKAIAEQKATLAEWTRLEAEDKEAERIENEARNEVVSCIRAMNKDVQSYYSKSPETARLLLRHENSVSSRRRNARRAEESASASAGSPPLLNVVPGALREESEEAPGEELRS